MNQKMVIKQDINFLDKPLWFADLRHDGKGFIWNDDDNGFEYRSGYTPPDKTDAIILYYLLYRSQQLEYQEKIVLTRYEILKECGLQKTSHNYYYKRLEESLERWKNITIKFHGTFYDRKEYKFFVFGIMDRAKIREEDKLVEVHFNPDWLLKIKESGFFKLLNFEYIKALKRPVSLRFYEILCKNFKGRDECYFKLTTLGEKLTLSGRKIITGVGQSKKEREVIYASDVLVAIKPAIKEISKLAMTPDIAKKTGIPLEDLFTISYRIEGEKQERIIYIKKHLVFPQEQQNKNPELAINIMSEQLSSSVGQTLSPILKKTIEPKLSDELEKQYQEGIEWLKQIVPNFNFKTLQTMDGEELAMYFPKLKIKVETEITNGKIENLAAYILDCIRHKWELPKSNKEQQREEKERFQKTREAKSKEVLVFIEGKGGIKNLLYNSQPILHIHSDGIEIEDIKYKSSSFTFFERIDLKNFTIKEE